MDRLQNIQEIASPPARQVTSCPSDYSRTQTIHTVHQTNLLLHIATPIQNTVFYFTCVPCSKPRKLMNKTDGAITTFTELYSVNTI